MDQLGKNESLLTDEDIQALVSEKLDLAFENGHDQTNDECLAVAVDMTTYDGEIFNLVAQEFDGEEQGLIPYILFWQRSRMN
jgi:hypothetical protein